MLEPPSLAWPHLPQNLAPGDKAWPQLVQNTWACSPPRALPKSLFTGEEAPSVWLVVLAVVLVVLVPGATRLGESGLFRRPLQQQQ